MEKGNRRAALRDMLPEGMAFLCAVLMLVALPLIFHDAFFDINRIKVRVVITLAPPLAMLYLLTGALRGGCLRRCGGADAPAAAMELLLLVWRWGRFGKSRPFWKTGPDWGWSQHIDIYDWTGKNFRPAWMASDIGLDAAAWQFDEQQRLVITERDGRESAWDWISWGLVRIA